jgi:uncharacterized protein with ParB-like and HNH nuclease domain
MEDVFKPHSLTIKQLFGDSTSLYQIPRYQRPYSWGDEQLEKLWDDLREAQEIEPNYFLGSVITAKPEEASNYIDIVDGQQRLTTLLIMLCVYRDLYPNINFDLIENDPFAVDINIIKTCIKYNDRFERLRLKTHSNHESDFQNYVLKEGVATKNAKPYKKDLKKEEDPKFKFMNTSAFFTEKLQEIGEHEAGIFINYLFNNVKIIRIDCHSVTFAIKLFQVLNDRGLDLSNSDLIKSFLIGQIHKLYDKDVEVKKQKENQFMDDWKYCENIAIDTEESLNDLFVIYEYYLLGENPKKSLYDELQKKLENTDPNQAINEFKAFVTHYKNSVYYREDSIMYGFWYLRWSMYWRSIVLTALTVDYQEYEEFLLVFKRYYYINWIAGNTLTKIKQTSFNIIGWLKENQPLDFIKAKLEEGLTDETVQRAVNNLNGDIYNEPWCKPLLFMIEYNQQDNPNYFNMGERNIHVEHILPKAYLKNKDWQYFHELEGIDTWINTGANLTLLSGSKNISASNDGFEKKVVAYDRTGNHSRTDTKITSFKITQNIVNDYNSNTFEKQWNAQAMNYRWLWFCEEVERLLEIDLTVIKGEVIEVE